MVPRAQGAPLVAAEAGPQVRGARAQHEGDVEAALERDVGAAAGPAAGEDEAVAEAGIAPIERPQFDIVQMERGKPLIYKATVALRPTVEIDGYQQIEIKPDTVEVKE